MTRTWIPRRSFVTPWPALVVAAVLTAAPGLAQESQSDAPRPGGRLSPVLALDQAVPGAPDRDVRWPVAVAAGADGELAVADAYGPRLLILRREGGGWQVERSEELPGPPVALVHDGTGYVAALRGVSGLVAFEGSDLLQRRIALPSGVVPGALAARPGGGLLVYDLAGSRVLPIGREGGVRDAGDGVPVDGRVHALAATSGGGFYAAVGKAGEVRRYDAQGGLEATWTLPAEGPAVPWPAGLAVEPGGDVVAVDRHGHRLVVFATDGSVEGSGGRRGWEPGLLLFPAGVTRLPDGRFAVADQGNGRVQIFRRIDVGGS